MVWRGGQPRPVWNLTDSQAKELSNENLTSYANQNYNTPRILELDVNRMLIGQNNVSTRVRAGLTDDRLVNAVKNSVRSYVTVNRPTVAPGQSRFSAEGAVPPSTPYRPLSGHSRSDQRRIPTSPPLPPIHLSRGHAGSKVVEIHSPSAELSYPPRSPPGSSLRLTPPLKERGVPSPLDAFA
ncbi:uncharacterized protein LOC135462755 [Liolophura sinensis]|uniref:uncharacterized protein LOC135462755 n=1 Tax=Liolophura sinensis TaxID=3198878 RepID=UPI003159553C